MSPDELSLASGRSWGDNSGSPKATKSAIPPASATQTRASSRVSFAASGPRSSQGFMAARASSVHPTMDFERAVAEMASPTPFRQDSADFKLLARYFLGFWKAPHAAAALGYMERLEIKRTLRALQKQHGLWCPPAEVLEALRKSAKPAHSNLPDTKEARNLKFVLKILGCSLHEDKPYRQFLKAKTLRQKRHWLYKYQAQKYAASSSYTEPICPVRLKRLFHFFPNNFKEEDGVMYFNNKMISYDETKNIYYIGKELDDE